MLLHERHKALCDGMKAMCARGKVRAFHSCQWPEQHLPEQISLALCSTGVEEGKRKGEEL